MYTDSKPLFESIYTRTQIKRDDFEMEAFSLTLNISNSSWSNLATKESIKISSS